MKITPQITLRNIEHSPALKKEIISYVEKLEKFHDHITGCRVSVEKKQKHQDSGNPYRVRIDVTVPPGHEIVIKRKSTEGELHQPLSAVLNEAFEATERKLKKLKEIQSRDVKKHPEQEVNGVIYKLFKSDGYGFIKSTDGSEVYFHRNSVLHNKFDGLKTGTGVHYVEEMGEKGPQASTVRVITRHSL